MNYLQLTENRDYSLAKKVFGTLSDDAQHYIRSWESMNWDQGDLSVSFESNDKIAQEIYKKFEPVRKNMRKRYGDSMTLYRGIIDDENRPLRSDRLLFSWTSSKKMARVFAGNSLRDQERQLNPVTDQEIENALKRYEKTGFVKFRNKKYIKNKQMPKYYNIYDRYNNNITDGDDLEQEFRDYQERVDELIKDKENIPGRIVEKQIPIDDIIWVLMGGNANEYIVRGHPE